MDETLDLGLVSLRTSMLFIERGLVVILRRR